MANFIPDCKRTISLLTLTETKTNEAGKMRSKVTFSVPEQARPGTLTWDLVGFNADFDADTLKLILKGENGESFSVVVPADLIPKGIQRSVLQRAINDGKLTGTVS